MKKMSLIGKYIKHIVWFLSSLYGYFLFRNQIDEDTYVFISHNGDSAGGAPVVLFELMKTLKSEKKMIFLCEKPGSIMDLCANENIPSYCTYLLQKLYMKRIKEKNVEVIIINTLAMHRSIQYFNQPNCITQVLWWIHEERNLITRYMDYIPKKIQDNIKILCVSSSVNEDLIKVAPQCLGRTKIFYYGCNDLFVDHKNNNNDRGRFDISVIGRICERKNQIQVLEAYDMLPKNIKNKIFINFISASADIDYKMRLLQGINNRSNIKLLGPIERKEMVQVYENSNLIICPSTDDPLPVVITEAMMLKRPFITSSRTGQYSIVEDGVNGFTYDVNSSLELCEKIIKVYEANDLGMLTDKGRETYLDNFTPEIVKNHFFEIVFEVRHK